METLPPVELGAVILVPYGLMLLLRATLEKHLVVPADRMDRPKRQFYFDLCLSSTAGLLAVIYNFLYYRFPVASGLSLLFGAFVFGFFIGLDMSLARERLIIQDALRHNRLETHPQNLFSVTRKFSLVASATAVFVTLVITMVIGRDIVWLSEIDPESTDLFDAQLSVTYEIFFIMAVLLLKVGNIILSYSKNLKLLFNNQTQVLEKVTQGDLSTLVPVATSDEFGVIAGYTNAMIGGLRHRLHLMTSLKLAEEVQQNLLPRQAPRISGLDMAGTSIYCEQTGGDYYDFIPLSPDRLAVAVADAADHGVSAAMLMTTARAFLLYGVRHRKNPAELIESINRFLTKDSKATGRFVTLFYAEIDVLKKTLQWVRAGHEPALLYDRQEDTFRELTGQGMALGIDAEYAFETHTENGWAPESILMIGTDGIHETANLQGEMFGRSRLQALVRESRNQPAETIQRRIVASLNEFRGDAAFEDDVTLVIVKLL